MHYQPPDMEEIVHSRALLMQPRFATLWLTQGLAQTAQNAILFTLLILVLQLTGSSAASSVLVLAFILPSVFMGVFVAVLLDRFRKGTILVVTNLIRAGACILYLFFNDDVLAIYAISLVFSTSGLFFNPAIVSLIPSLVSRERLVNANSLYNFTLTGSQLAGMVFLAPAILKLADERAMFVAAGGLFTVAAARLSWRGCWWSSSVHWERSPEGRSTSGAIQRHSGRTSPPSPHRPSLISTSACSSRLRGCARRLPSITARRLRSTPTLPKRTAAWAWCWRRRTGFPRPSSTCARTCA